MRLRTFESFWLLKNGLLYSYPSLQKSIAAEIVVVGAGITGALVSHALIKKGYEVTLIDKRDVAQGSSSATTSMLQYEIDVPLIDLCEMIGEEDAVLSYKAGIEAIKSMEELVMQNQIDCGFQSKESLYRAHNKKAAKKLYKEFEIRQKHALGVSWLTREEIKATYGLESYGGILSSCGASIDAYKLAHELINLNVKRGMTVYDQTEVTKFNLNEDETNLEIKEGYTINCKKVILCTGFETVEMLKEKCADLFYTYACVSEKNIAVTDALKNTLVWDTNDPYTYMRTTDDDRLLIGGEDSSINFPFFQQKIKERKAHKLEKKLNKILPGISFITDFNWGGTFGTTKDGLPYIGLSPEYKNALFVLGFGGNGITFSVQAMRIIPDILQGKENKLAWLYRFGR